MASTALSTELSRDWIWLADSFSRKRVTNCSTLVPRSYTWNERDRNKASQTRSDEDKSTSALRWGFHTCIFNKDLLFKKPQRNTFKQNTWSGGANVVRFTNINNISSGMSRTYGLRGEWGHTGKACNGVGSVEPTHIDLVTFGLFLQTQGLFYSMRAECHARLYWKD